MNNRDLYNTIILALEYYDGEHGEDNRGKAFELFQNVLKEDPDNTYAINNLGNCYINGIGTEADLKKAQRLYRKAAEKGDVNAQFNLAKSLEEEKDPECIDWYNKAFQKGDIDAPQKLSLIYYAGEIVPQSIELYVEYANKAIDVGNVSSMLDYAYLLINGENIEKDVFQGAQLMHKAANAGSRTAMSNLALLYERGIGVNVNLDSAIEWGLKAAKEGDTDGLAAVASDLFYGKYYIENKQKGVELFELVAEFGNLGCAENIALCYVNGVEVEQNIEKAIYFYEKAALLGSLKAYDSLAQLYKNVNAETSDQRLFEAVMKGVSAGNADAYYRAHLYYKEGTFVEEDDTVSYNYLRKALDLNFPKAYNILGEYYIKGDFGYEKDPDKAIKSWEYSYSLQENSYLARILGNIYLGGKEVPQNITKAVEWFEKSKESGMDAISCFNLGTIYCGDVFNNCEMHDMDKAIENFEIASKNGIAEADAFLGDYYRIGKGVEIDYEKSFEHYMRAAENDIGFAMYRVSIAYSSGLGTVKDSKESKLWLDKAADKKVPEACDLKGRILADLNDYSQAVTFLKIAADSGNPDSITALADIYFDGGNGIEQDMQEAVHLYKRAADMDHTYAQYRLGLSYYSGEGSPKDFNSALYYLNLAAEKGEYRAKFALATMYRFGWGVNVDMDKALSLATEVLYSDVTFLHDDASRFIDEIKMSPY